MDAVIEPTLGSDELEGILGRLQNGNDRFAAAFPGESEQRQPVHTVYGGAQLFRAGSTVRMGEVALAALERYAPDGEALADALEWTGRTRELAPTIHERVVAKLRREAVEDFRIDFEDGYGNRPDAEEDGDARSAAEQVAAGLAAGTLPPFIGIRVKPFTAELHRRGLRTLDLFVTSLLERTGGALPEGFVITLPKVTIPEQSEAADHAIGALEHKLGLAEGTIPLELMVETPQSIFDERGGCSLLSFVAAGAGRITAAHFGTYDYTASCGITAAYQHMRHPACDFARHVMQVALAGTGIWLSDGATNILPVALHRAGEGTDLSESQRAENRAAIHRAWRLHYDDIQHSLVHGFYQGWDLHPAQLVTRYAAVYAFFLQSLDAASERLRNFIAKAAQATLVGEVFDDAATGQGLLNYFLRAVNCGAVREDEIERLSGLTLVELRSASFVKIVKGRRVNPL